MFWTTNTRQTVLSYLGKTDEGRTMLDDVILLSFMDSPNALKMRGENKHDNSRWSRRISIATALAAVQNALYIYCE